MEEVNMQETDMTILSIDLIASHPKVRNGSPVVAGTGIRVMDIAAATIFHQRTPDDLAVDYDLSLAQVYAALSYYYAHKAEIDEEIRQQDEAFVRLKEESLANRRSLLP